MENVHEQWNYEAYASLGGLLTKDTYTSVLSSCMVEKPSEKNIISRMIRLISQTPLEQKDNRNIDFNAVGHIYSYLRKPRNGPCNSWSDEKIFAEALLLHGHTAAYKTFKSRLPQFSVNRI